MKKIIFILLFVCGHFYLSSQSNVINIVQSKKFLFSDKAFIINESFLSYIEDNHFRKFKNKKYRHLEAGKELFFICNYTDKNIQQQFLILEKEQNIYRFIVWDTFLNDWYTLATFSKFPTFVNPNQCGVIDKFGNYCSFNSWMAPFPVSCRNSTIKTDEKFSLYTHEEDYLSNNKTYFILDNFSGGFTKNYLTPTKILNAGFIPMDFFYLGNLSVNDISYVHHTVKEGVYTLLCLKKEQNEECITLYTFYHLITNGKDINQLVEIGTMSYIGNDLYQYDINPDNVIGNNISN